MFSKTHTLTDLLRRDKDWNFDIFAFSDLTSGKNTDHKLKCLGRPLLFISKYLFKKHNLIEKFGLDMGKLSNYLDRIDYGYQPENPYHNNIHAADVVLNCHWLIVKGGLIK